eukprot:2865251-Alexandrium_andersonii.AAC.1
MREPRPGGPRIGARDFAISRPRTHSIPALLLRIGVCTNSCTESAHRELQGGHVRGRSRVRPA